MRMTHPAGSNLHPSRCLQRCSTHRSTLRNCVGRIQALYNFKEISSKNDWADSSIAPVLTVVPEFIKPKRQHKLRDIASTPTAVVFLMTGTIGTAFAFTLGHDDKSPATTKPVWVAEVKS
jgi:hypothetical protein